STEGQTQELPLAPPARPSSLLERLHVRLSPLPVQVRQPPAAAGQEQDDRPLLPAGQEGRVVNVPQFLLAVEDGELRGRREHREQLQEVLAAVAVLPLPPQPQYAGVFPEDFLR